MGNLIEYKLKTSIAQSIVCQTMGKYIKLDIDQIENEHRKQKKKQINNLEKIELL